MMANEFPLYKGDGEMDLDLDFGDIGLSDLAIDFDGFDFGDGGDKLETRYVKPKFYVGDRRASVLYENAVKLASEIGPAILNGERVDVLVSGNFIFGDFLEAFAVETNCFIDDLTMSTLSVSKDNVDSLRNLVVGDYVGALNLIVSDYWYSHNRVNIQYLYDQLDVDDKFQLAVAGTHTKIVLLRIGERKIVMHGSANLRSSRSVESFTVETEPTAYDFHHEWHSRIIAQYGTVRKSVRASALFDLIQEAKNE